MGLATESFNLAMLSKILPTKKDILSQKLVNFTNFIGSVLVVWQLISNDLTEVAQK